jgi:hypothetical protein
MREPPLALHPRHDARRAVALQEASGPDAADLLRLAYLAYQPVPAAVPRALASARFAPVDRLHEGVQLVPCAGSFLRLKMKKGSQLHLEANSPRVLRQGFTYTINSLATIPNVCYNISMPLYHNTKAKGEMAEGFILSALLQKGFSVSIPFGNNQRYDMIIDDGNKLLRAQCKTGRLIMGCVSFSVASKNGFTNVRRSYHNDIEIFLVYCQDINKVYKVPVGITPTNEMRLRIESVKSHAPQSAIHWAKDYEL